MTHDLRAATGDEGGAAAPPGGVTVSAEGGPVLEGAPLPAGTVVVAILNWCAEADTARAVASVEAHGGDRVVVLVVDNASPDGSGAA